MPRNMSFMLTKSQIKSRTKDVTRRLGWYFLRPGVILNAVEKSMGLKRGEKVVCICQIKVISTKVECLNEITKNECSREGFPEMTPEEFISMFCAHNHCNSDHWVNRIEFEYIGA